MKSGLIAINISAIIFGSAALYGKLEVSPVWIVAIRGAFAAMALLVYGFCRGGLVSVTKREELNPIVFTGILLAIHWLSFFKSVQIAGIAIATLTFATFPLFTVLISSLASKRFPVLLEVFAGGIIVVAVGLLVDFNASEYQNLGLFAGLLSAATFSLFGVLSKKLTSKLPPLTVSLSQNIVVSLCLFPFLPSSLPMPSSTSDWLCLLSLGVITTAVMHQLYLFSLTKLSATTCSGFVALEPVYAVTFAAIFFREPITLWIVLSGFLILFASLLMLFSEKQSQEAH